MRILGGRLRAGVVNLRIVGRNVAIRSFGGVLVFINFILLFNFKFTTLAHKHVYSISEYRVRRYKRFRRRVNLFVKRTRLLGFMIKYVVDIFYFFLYKFRNIRDYI